MSIFDFFKGYFAFFYGTFGYTETSDLSVFKLACFAFSWYLISTSLMVYCVFNVRFTRDYLYNLLGKDFVVKKIGNPGLRQLLKYGGAAVVGIGINDAGRLTESWVNVKNAQTSLEGTLSSLDQDTNLSAKDKSRIAKEAFATKNQMVMKPCEGTFDRLAKIDAYKSATTSVSNAASKIFGK